MKGKAMPMKVNMPKGIPLARGKEAAVPKGLPSPMTKSMAAMSKKASKKGK